MPTVIITGAGRGLGLEFARQYRAEGWDVVATARSPSDELEALGVAVETLAMDDFAAIAEFGGRFNRPLDVLIANAGVMGPLQAKSGDDAEQWLDTLKINSIAPVVLAQALMPRLAEAKGKAVAVSSQMGSIQDSSGGYIPYRSSKAALNMAWHVLADDARGSNVTFATVHPGWVQTDMGGAGASITPEESITDLRHMIAELSPELSGSFLNRDGSIIPW